MSENVVDFSRFRAHIQSALDHAGDTHSVDDVEQMVAAGHAQFWPGPASLVITETITHPQKKLLHFFLAAGVRHELDAMTPHLLDYGRSIGCHRATLVGRKGWTRRLPDWQASDLVLMSKEL